jgi:hypothetical protein
MSSKIEKLNQRLQELVGLLDDHKAIDGSFISLQTIVQTVQQRSQDNRLSLHLLGYNPSLLQAWQSILADRQTVNASYIIATHPLIKQPNKDHISDCFNCDVIIFIQDDPKESLQEYIQISSDRPIAQRILMTVFHEDGVDNADAIDSNLKSSLDEMIAVDSQSSDTAQAKLQKRLESIVRRRSGDILAQRLMVAVRPVFDEVESHLTQSQQTCDETLQQLRSQFETISAPDASNLDALQSTQACINEQFKQIENAIRQSRSGILDEFNRHSLTYKIQARTDQLQPVIIRRRGAQYLQLQSNLASNSTEINMDMIQLCYGYLSHWMIDEWRRVQTVYGDGGLNRLYQIAHQMFPQTNSPLPDSTESLSVQVSRVRQSFQDCIAPVHCEIYLKESSIGNYLIRQLRNQWMGIMFIMTFIGMIGIGGGSRSEMMQAFFSPIVQLKDNPLWLFVALAIPLCLIFLFLFNGYYVNSACKVEESAEKLKKQVRSYYQGFSKHITDDLIMGVLEILQIEHHRLMTLLNQVQAQHQLRLTEEACHAQSLQDKIDRCLSHKKNLQQTLSSLQRLRRF